MNTIVGMLLGCLLTVGVVYVHDTMATSPVANGNASTSRPIVDWNAASEEWHHVTSGVRTAWLRLNSDFKRS